MSSTVRRDADVHGSDRGADECEHGRGAIIAYGGLGDDRGRRARPTIHCGTRTQ
jgi:hypothetical protein